MAGRYFGVPFATTGNRTVTPDAVQPDGSVSYSEGFGFDYERPNTDPAYKPVPRDGMNGLFYDITEAVGIMQRQGVADWTASAAPYAIKSIVRHNDAVWISAIANNSAVPGTDASWASLPSSSDFGALAFKGSINNADWSGTALSVANGGTGATTAAGARATLDVYSKAESNGIAIGVGQTWQDLTASRSAGVTYTNTTGRTICVSVSTISASGSDVVSQYMTVGGVIVSRFFMDTDTTGVNRATVMAIVPAGATYSVTVGAGVNLDVWSELR